MDTKDLIDSIVHRFKKRNPHSRNSRLSNPAYYNWLLLDLARRAAIVQKRLENQFKLTSEVEFRRQVIEVAASSTAWFSIKPSRSFGVVFDDNEYFDLFAPFVLTKRQQMLETARMFGDEICALIEFIDMNKIANLPREEFHVFIKELSLVKEKMKDIIEILKPLFDNDPVHPYETMTPLN
ncbi:hypothetical protein BJV82DRAFT_585695 [Fennellomyces sp. T-0311]|nr:hypothetical protein BJV82DRAFT_585695 [Fennellomyces sp. T-0311]